MQGCTWHLSVSAPSSTSYIGSHCPLLCSPRSSPAKIPSIRPSLPGVRFLLGRARNTLRSDLVRKRLRIQGYNANVGVGSFGADDKQDDQEISGRPVSDDLAKDGKSNRSPIPLYLAGLLVGASLIGSAAAFMKAGPSALMSAVAKSGFTAAFTLIFVSEIGDKTFFIAALLAMQYRKGLVLLGSMLALSLMTVLSVVIGLIFHSVPAQFQTTLPIGEFAAIALLLFFGVTSIKNAWELPSDVVKRTGNDSPELGEFVEAEELVKEKVAKRLTNPFEIVWKSFSLVFFAEWGDRSMLATIALGAAQSPWGVASGAIAGHLVATSLAVVGGAFLANYISEKLVGYLGGGLFLGFAVATLMGVF
ncbi:protein PAM71-homolog, chloroplastic [Nymphaea colorata]|uniref:protein PAM71-homolog, chloroplastic n=1 Tax=Nymphaea colorata TaxID=210225 RepID=UPI00129D6A45|nr:protein PAM71-homolog, chloroplastic [Nymphaea colorata]